MTSSSGPAEETLIATHDVSDYDAIASQVAARALYPGSILLRSPSVGHDVHPYVALHRDRIGGTSPERVPWARVRRLVVVDVRRRSRLGHLAPLLERRAADASSLEVVVYDHHPASADDLHADREVVERVGSTTTLLVEEIERNGVAIDGVEATLMALGLHADTGSLCFTNTTARDAHALAYLLERGADVRVLMRYLHAPLDAARRHVLTALLTAAELRELGGLSLGVAMLDAPKNMSGLDDLTNRAHDVLGCHVLLAIYSLGGRKVQVIARSRSRAIDVAALLVPLGGGGHPSAAAAALPGADPEATRARLLEMIVETPRPQLTARDLMSSPVHSVTPDTPLSELARRLTAWGHSGACVLRDGRLMGVISRSDVARAERVGRAHLAVKSVMPTRLFTTGPSEPLEHVLALMEEHDIGRLPVVTEGRLIGIVTRTDARRALYADERSPGSVDADRAL